VILRPAEELSTKVERSAGLNRADGYYAILESAFRARQGWTVEEGRRRISEMYSEFSNIAARNPHAWRRVAVDADAISTPTERNPMMAFPYTRAHISSWSVDQAGALLFCSAGLARELDIPRERWVFPVVSSESNHMVNVSNRRDLGRSEAVDIVVEAALRQASLAPADLTLLDLYSCFPVAVEMFAVALGVPVGSRALTITGGMPWAGGPFNNYVIQSTAQMALQLRSCTSPSTGLTTCVSGMLTKIGAGVWSTDQPSAPFAHIDVSNQVNERGGRLPSVDNYSGSARVVGYTVLHGRRGAHGVLIVDVPEARTVVSTSEPDYVASMERDDWIGRSVDVSNGQLVP
jgi:acetyl-CoA C-acetyltransferase